ncbi:MAG TPA: hypothetical protein VGF13_03350, partial [Verrucomicrobiae bacterium]
MTSLRAADIATARQQLISGDYTNCVATCEQAIANFEYEEEWRVLLVKSLVAIGKYPEAGTVISNALDRYSWSIPLRLLAHEVLPFTGGTNRAAEALREIESLVSSRTDSRIRDASTMVAIGNAILLLGADPRKVLDNVFGPTRKANPDHRGVYLAMGQLALGKHDFDLAAKQFGAGLKKFPDDPDM